jgi:uncharacterized protein DUF6527
MSRIRSISHEFVNAIPDRVQEGVLYVSLEYATAVHNCCCGCGQEVVTPLSPTDWKLIFDGESVSLFPSVGNWSFACRSHYWIDRGHIQWAGEMSDAQVQQGRFRDRLAKQYQFGEAPARHRFDETVAPTQSPADTAPSFWQRILRLTRGRS